MPLKKVTLYTIISALPYLKGSVFKGDNDEYVIMGV